MILWTVHREQVAAGRAVQLFWTIRRNLQPIKFFTDNRETAVAYILERIKDNKGVANEHAS